jgi:hypothetical protein
MQWLINEWKAFKKEVIQLVEDKKDDAQLTERVTKLEGELKAMKARMGKKSPDEQ